MKIRYLEKFLVLEENSHYLWINGEWILNLL